MQPNIEGYYAGEEYYMQIYTFQEASEHSQGSFGPSRKTASALDLGQ